MTTTFKLAILTCATLFGGAAVAATAFGAPVVVSTQVPDGSNAYKAKMVSQAYKSSAALPTYDVRATTMVYADNSVYGGRDIWVARSVDNGATWTHTPLTANAGTPVTVQGYKLLTTNGKPNIYAPATGVVGASGAGANIVVTWASSYCRNLADSALPSAEQKVNLNLLEGPQPFMCLWTARSVNGGVNWMTQQVTDGGLDVDEDVPAGYTTANLGAGGFGIAWQADPAGLKQGQAEGPGEGASGASVSKGTNVWYTYLTKANFESGLAFPTPAVALSDNDPVTNPRGASRPNLAIVGGTAVMAYEETKGDSDAWGKQIIYHSFPYAAPVLNSAGTVVSDPSLNARRVRILSQGDASAGTSPLRLVLLWRQTSVNTPGAPSDVVALRGLKNPVPPTGTVSTGFMATDIEPFAAARNLSNLLGVRTADNALAQRGILRGGKVAVGFDYTPDMAAADAVRPTRTYNFYITTSQDSGVTWGSPRNLSWLLLNGIRVVEPRIVGTPGSILNPDGTATGNPLDVQAPDTFFIAYGIETNSDDPRPLNIWMNRTEDFGGHYELPRLLGGLTLGQAEAQLRITPNGKDMQGLWMQTFGVVTDVYFRSGSSR